MPAATFDGTNLIVNLPAPASGLLTMDAREDIYSDWKVFVKGTGHIARKAFDTTAGDPITGGILEAVFFLRNDLGWRIQATDENQEVTIDGNLFPRDSTLPMFLPRAGRTITYALILTANPRGINDLSEEDVFNQVLLGNEVTG